MILSRPLRLGLLLTVAVLAFLLPPQIYAQIDEGVVLGTVRDSSGAVVPGAKATLTNEGTGIKATTTTGTSGGYVFAHVKVGVYTVTIEFQGFETASHPKVGVDIDQQVVVDFGLLPGRITQTVEVTAEVPTLQTQNASVGQVVGSTEINDLPLNGRNYVYLATLAAGSTDVYYSNRGGVFEASGAPIEQNSFTLNGLDNNNEGYNFPWQWSVRPPVDALQEFKMQTNNYSAEFGRSAGAVVNATTKSGTNQFHGDVWEFVRNDKFDSANFFENSPSHVTKGEYRQNQFGGTLGGPISIPHVYNGKNRTFFFVDYEGTRIRQASPYLDSVPTSAESASGFTNLLDRITGQGGTRTDTLGRVFPLGTVFDPATSRVLTKGMTDPVSGLPCNNANGCMLRDPFYQGSLVGMTNFTTSTAIPLLNQIPAGRLDQNMIKLLGILPGPSTSGIFNNFTYDPATRDTVDQFDVRIDHSISAKDQLFGTFDWQKEPKFIPVQYPGEAGGQVWGAGNQKLSYQGGEFGEIHTLSPTTVNEFRIGFNRNPSNLTLPQPPGLPAQFGIQGISQAMGNVGLPAINISGLTGMGTEGWMPSNFNTGVTELNDNLSKVYNKHTFKGGIDFIHIKAYLLQPPWSHGGFGFDGTYDEVPNNGGGSVGLAQLLLTPTATTVPGGINDVGGADSVFASNIAGTDDTRNYYGAYFQDDWKITSKLTINLGLRWDRYDPYQEDFGAQANFIPGAPGSASFLIPNSRCKEPMSTSFAALTALDGIAVSCSSNPTLSLVQNTNFAPRVGFAYRVTSKLVARGGYGIFYGALSNIGYGPNLGENYPFQFSFSFFNPDAVHPIKYASDGNVATLEEGFLGIPLTPTLVNASGLSLVGRQYNYQTPYDEGANFTLQYQLSPNQTAQLAYVGTFGRHLDVGPTTNATSEILPNGSNPQNYVPFPDFSRGSTYEATDGSSYYHSLQFNYERRFAGGFSLLGNYTLSKCRSDFNGGLLGVNVGGAGYRAPYLSGFGIQADYGLCDYDMTNVVHVSGIYQLPFGNGKHFAGSAHGVANAIVGGWSANWILTLRDGMPFNIGCPEGTTANFGCNAFIVPGQNMYAGPHDVNQWMNPAAFAQPPLATAVGQTDYSPLGGAPYQVRGPGFHRLDFSLFKQFRTSDRTRLEFRAEAFNLTNTPQFQAPGYTDFTNLKTFGQITSLIDGASDPRQIQFALKFYF